MLKNTTSISGGGGGGAAVTLGCPIGRSRRHIFLSYRRLDRELATTVKQALESFGYVVFMDVGDSGLGAGDFQAQLEQVLHEPLNALFFCTRVSLPFPPPIQAWNDTNTHKRRSS